MSHFVIIIGSGGQLVDPNDPPAVSVDIQYRPSHGLSQAEIDKNVSKLMKLRQKMLDIEKDD